MNDSRKQELAFLYVADALEAEDKPAVFQLILEDASFRQSIKEEIELRTRLQSIRKELDLSTRNRLYERIQQQLNPTLTNSLENEQPSKVHWGEYALRLTLPPLVQPIVTTLQRRYAL